MGKILRTMREIKFRAWEKDADNPQAKGLKGVMICNDHLMEFPVRLVNCIQNVKDRYILMQYTALKDKNEKDIYEGDICNVTVLGGIEGQDEDNIGSIDYEDQWAMYIITCKNKHIEVLPHLASAVKDKWWLPLSDCIKIEVIGNIYETPELL